MGTEPIRPTLQVFACYDFLRVADCLLTFTRIKQFTEPVNETPLLQFSSLIQGVLRRHSSFVP